VRHLLRSRLLIFALLAFVGFWGFVEIADEVLEGNTHRFDSEILLSLREPQAPGTPIGPRWLQEVARDVTSLGGTAVLTLLAACAVGYLILIRQAAAALLTALALGGGTLFSALLKSGFDRPRPDLVPHAVEVYSASFPSGHAMLATVTYLTLGALLARVQTTRRAQVYLLTWAIFLSILIGVSRVYLGVHWPTDVLAGWCVGAAWAVLCATLELGLQRVGVITVRK
jgi:undecaprenyl-diphosphatase